MQRIAKIDPTTLVGEAKDIFERWSPGGRPLNIVLIYFRNVELNRNWSYMATHLFMKNSLSDRQREIIVLRVSWQCASDYEFIQHVRIAREGSLLSEREIRDLLQATTNGFWNEAERGLIALSDELLAGSGITDETWSTLSRFFDDKQLMDAVATAGGYTLNSMATSSFGVDIEDTMQREEGLVPSQNAPAFRFYQSPEFLSSPPKPRVGRLELPSVEDRARSLIAPYIERDERAGFFLTIAGYSRLVRDWMPIIRYIDEGNTLDRETRALISLRTAYRCGCLTGWQDREAVARRAGVSGSSIESARQPAEAIDATGRVKLLVETIDELFDDMIVSDDVWVRLSGVFDERQIMDIVFATATELMICWMQNALGVQPSEC